MTQENNNTDQTTSNQTETNQEETMADSVEKVEEVELTKEEVLAAENAELKTKVLKAMAETENLRKRHQKELSDANKYAATKFAKDMLAVQDNMARALDTLSKIETKDEHLTSTLDGIKMVSSGLENSFKQAGVEKIIAIDTQLNPELHQAISQVDSDKEPGTVINVFQEGYTMHGRLLRPAMVVVAK